MRNVCRMVLTLTVAGILASPLAAAEEKKAKGKKKGQRQARNPVTALLKPVADSLTDEQKAKIEPISKEYGPKLGDLQKKSASILTAEQKKAGQQALTAARDAGKKGKDLRDARAAALKLTAEQKKQMEDINAARQEVMGKVRTALASVLTDEQKEKIPGLKQRKGKGKGKKKKDAA